MTKTEIISKYSLKYISQHESVGLRVYMVTINVYSTHKYPL